MRRKGGPVAADVVAMRRCRSVPSSNPWRWAQWPLGMDVVGSVGLGSA